MLLKLQAKLHFIILCHVISSDIKSSVKIQIYTKVKTITLRFMVIYLFSYSGDEGFQSFFNVYIL